MRNVQSGDAPLAREAAYISRLLEDARRAAEHGQARLPLPSRRLSAAAKTMARHLQMPDDAVSALWPSLARWQMSPFFGLPSQMAHFTEASRHFPWSFANVRSSLAAIQTHPQVVVVAFHSAGLPLVVALVAAAWAQIHPGPRHALLATGNLGLLKLPALRWAAEAGHIFGTCRRDMADLLSGLKTSEIQRLVIMIDGPRAPSEPGTIALSRMSGLAFKTGLLRRILTLGIPVLPLTHHWGTDSLTVTAHPPLIGVAPRDGISSVAATLEHLLGTHPEQWLNWTAASLRT